MNPHGTPDRHPVGAPASQGGQFRSSSSPAGEIGTVALTRPHEYESPVRVDEQLAELYGRRADLERQHERAVDALHAEAGDRRDPRTRQWSMTWDEVTTRATSARARRHLDQLTQAAAQLEACDAAQARLDDEFDARGGWSRAFLVSGGDGHVHSSMSCSTCNRGERPTSFAFMTDYSGADEEQIVADAGWRACTVCYPSAPVGDEKTLPTRMFSADELAAQRARGEREQARARKEADRLAKAITPDGSPMQVEYGFASGNRCTERFATERAATQWWVDSHVYTSAQSLPYRREALEAIEQAIATKHGRSVEDVRAQLERKAAAKRKREGRA